MGTGSRSSAASRKTGLWQRRSSATANGSLSIATVAAVSMSLLRASVGSTEASASLPARFGVVGL
jgi:hypothetical protein